jgi:signal recognition particle subunit SRP68
VKRDVDAKNAKDPRHLLIPLVEAERAWSFFMHVKQQQQPAPSPYARGHGLRRLERAAHHAARLEAVCRDAAEPRTLIEATAYAAWMRGNVAMERQLWAEASERFEVSRNVCEQLSRVGLPEQRAVFAERLEELTPKLRFCAYHMKSGGDAAKAADVAQAGAAGADLRGLIEGVVSEAAKATQGLRDVQWKGRAVPVRSAKVHEKLGRARDESEQASKSTASAERLRAYDHVFVLLSEAQQLLRDEKAVQIRVRCHITIRRLSHRIRAL